MMTRNLLVLLCVVLVSCPAAGTAQDSVTVDAKHYSWDFGYLPQRANASHTFYIVNPGADSLEITEIKPGCSCTSVSDATGPVAPGDSAAVTITFRSGRYHKFVRKITGVRTDDSTTPKNFLHLVSRVYRPGEPTGGVKCEPPAITPPMVDAVFDAIPDTLRVRNLGTDTLAVDVLRKPERLITNLDFPTSIPPGADAEFIINWQRPLRADEIFGETFTLKFSGKDETIITVPLIGKQPTRKPVR